MTTEISYSDVHSSNDELWPYEFINRRGAPERRTRQTRDNQNAATSEFSFPHRTERDPWLEVTDGFYYLQETVQLGTPHTDIAFKFYKEKDGEQVTPEAGWIDIWYEAIEDKFFKPEEPVTGGVKGRVDATKAGKFADYDSYFHLQPILGARIGFGDIVKRPADLPKIYRSEALPVNKDDTGGIAKLGIKLSDAGTDPVRMYVVNGENDDIGTEAVEFFGQPQHDPAKSYAEFDTVISGGKYWTAKRTVGAGAPLVQGDDWDDNMAIDMVADYASGTSYTKYDIVNGNDRLFVSKVDANQNNALPTTNESNDEWDFAGFLGDVTEASIRLLGDSSVARVPSASNSDRWYDAGAKVPAYRQGTDYPQFTVVEYGTYAYIATEDIDGAEQKRENANPRQDTKWHRLLERVVYKDEYLHQNPGLQVVQIPDFEAGKDYGQYSVVKYNGKYWTAKKDVAGYAEASRSIGQPDVSSLGQVNPWKVVQGEETNDDWSDEGDAAVSPPVWNDGAYSKYDLVVFPQPRADVSSIITTTPNLAGSQRLGHTRLTVRNNGTSAINVGPSWLTIQTGDNLVISARDVGVIGGIDSSAFPRISIPWADITALPAVTAGAAFNTINANQKIENTVTVDGGSGRGNINITLSIMKVGSRIYYYAQSTVALNGPTDPDSWRPGFWNETITDVPGKIFSAERDHIAGNAADNPGENPGTDGWHDTTYTIDHDGNITVPAFADGVFAEFDLVTNGGRFWVATGAIAAGDLAPGVTNMIEAADVADIPTFNANTAYEVGQLVKFVDAGQTEIAIVQIAIPANSGQDARARLTGPGYLLLRARRGADDDFANLTSLLNGFHSAYDANAAYVQYSVLLQGGKLYYAQIAVDASNTVEPGGETGLTELGRFRFVGINATAGGVTNRAVFTPLNINISNLENSADFKFYQVASLNGSISGITPQSTTVGDILGVNPIVPGDEYEVAGSDTSGFAIGIPHGTGNSLLIAHDGNGNLYGTALTPADNDVIYSAVFRGPDTSSYRLTGMIGAMGSLQVIIGEDSQRELFAYLLDRSGSGTRRLVTVVGNMAGTPAERKALLERTNPEADRTFPVYEGFVRSVGDENEDINLDRALDRIIRAQDAMRCRAVLRRWKS